MNDRIAPRNLASLVGWLLVGFAGAGAIAILAISRGETVNALWMVVASVCVFAMAYRFHSAWLMAKVLTFNELRATPARIHEDGRDFVKTNRWIVFGHHFAAIAGRARSLVRCWRRNLVICPECSGFSSARRWAAQSTIALSSFPRCAGGVSRSAKW